MTPETTLFEGPIVLFDGVCNLCNRSVQFIIKRDPRAHFRFATLQSDRGQALLAEHHLPLSDFETFVLVKQGRVLLRSTAALHLLKELRGLWPVCSVFLVIPRPLRDAVYSWIARNRYRWFGRREVCMVPTEELQERFIR